MNGVCLPPRLLWLNVVSEDLTPHGRFMEDLESRIRPLLDLLLEGKLERFRYNFYSCS